ncbi:MAG: polysaccharide deacetylase family protein [Streptosporangiales bacterium]|nr:polysaccharide deacetylase family protein [Streptosporangiales bacterium]
MSRPDVPTTGPSRDFIGYGRFPPKVRWPNDASLVISVVLNYEAGAEYSLLEDGRNDSWGEHSDQIGSEIRDLGTETHFEFGSRVGVWRLARLFDRLRVPVSVGACAVALERNPAVAEWIVDAGHEALAHGYRWTENSSLTKAEEREHMLRSVEVFERLTGSHPLGWFVRSFPSVHTRELLVEEGGFLYDSDSCNDELPYFVDVHDTPFLVVPYSKVYNDSRYFLEPTYGTPRHFLESLRAGVEYLCQEVAEGGTPRMMSVGLHERWSGQANRACAVRDFLEYAQDRSDVIFMRRADIARWWIEHHQNWTEAQPGTSPVGSPARPPS